METVNNLDKNRLLIVGGTGFIGRSLTKCAIKKGYEVIVLSLNSPSVEEMTDNVEYLQVDITNIKNLRKKKINNIDYVVNLSGYIDHGCFLDGGNRVIDVHFGGVKNLLQILNWNKLKRFVQIGSSDEYGGALAPQHESLRESPISSYAVGKAASAQLLQMLAKTENFPVVILRLFLVYGPGQDSGRFLPQIIKGCFSGKEFETSSGEQLRDFCYIDDITDGILRALKSDNVNGEIINLASGDPISIRTVIEKVQTYIGKGSPKFGKISYRAGENMSLYADTSRAELLLGWRSKTTIKSGIKKIVDHYQVYNLK
jgi:nucleoside-diphosphate-sugar epimerase